MLSVISIQFDDWDLLVGFDDGTTKKVDIREWMKRFHQTEAKKIASNITYFQKAVVEDGAAISWPSGFSIEPDEIYDEGENVIQVAGTLKRVLSRFV